MRTGQQLLAAGGEGGTAAIKHVLECMAAALAAQDKSAATWAAPSHIQAFNFLAQHFDERRAKVRRSAHAAVLMVLREHHAAGQMALPTRAVGICSDVLAGCTSAEDCTRALHLLAFLEGALPLFPMDKVAALTTQLLGLLELGNTTLSTHVLRVLAVLLQSTDADIDVGFQVALCDKLLAMRTPTTPVTDADAAWAFIVARSAERLASTDRNMALGEGV